MTSSSIEKSKCPVCGEAAAGRFCANCGATLVDSTCTECGARLNPGALFCHRCGHRVGRAAEVIAPVDSSVPRHAERQSMLPWGISAIALLAALTVLATRGFNTSRGGSLDAPANALPQVGLDDRGAGSDDATAVRAPDISAMSPDERAERLFARVMIYATQGKKDSVEFFAPMAINAYEMLPQMNIDQHYDLGRIAEVSGALPLARAQADSILREQPRNLLGLILAARIADLMGDKAARIRYDKLLLASQKSELATKRPEYERHEDDIKRAVAALRAKQ